MSEKSGSWPQPSLPDETVTRETLGRIFTNAVKASRTLSEQALKPAAPLAFDPTANLTALWAAGLGLLSQPLAAANAQMRMWNEWSQLWSATFNRLSGDAAAPVIEPTRGDRRFSDPVWTEQPIFDHLKQGYLLAGRQLGELVDSIEGLDEDSRKRVSFLLRQYLDAVAPTNFAATNPEVVRKTLESGGANLLAGLANLLADVASGKGLVERRAADTFELGRNIAATPGAVVFQAELFQLIQYEPSTPQVARRPFLYVPPLVNKYYLMDLQPKSSLLKWLVDQGHSVFVISWVNPGPELRDKDFAAYVVEGVVQAMDVVREITGQPDVDIASFCMGGTLAAATAAYLAGRGEGDRVGSLTLIGTLLDFSDLREWSVFTGPSDLKALDRHVDTTGYVDSVDLQKLFSVVRANDLIWSSVVSHYLLDREAPPSDILFWFADGARIPAAFLRTYGEQLLRDNLLRVPGGVEVRGVPLDLGKVTAPALVVSLKDDHVSAWEATYAGVRLFGGPATFLLGGSGHNAGVINPPSANKHGYWTHEGLPETAEAWMGAAEKQAGSWWPAWEAWLRRGDGGEVDPPALGGGKLKSIEPAPGSYVRVR